MHGNVWTWCQDQAMIYPSGRGEDREDINDISDRISRDLRGGSFGFLARLVRSANRVILRPADRVGNVGVRVSRTYH
jgi:formylglycine-generating enzyme required for sulfatase activity